MSSRPSPSQDLLALDGEAEAQFRTLIEAIPAPVFYKDRAGRYLGCNRAFEELVGLERSEILGRTVEDLPTGPDLATHGEVDESLLERPGSKVYESSLLDAAGRQREIVVHKATFRHRGRVTGIVGFLLDVTEQKAAERALRTSEALRRSVTDASPDRIVLVDPDGTVRFVNGPLGELDATEAVGTSFFDHLPESERDTVRRTFARVLETGEAATYEGTMSQEGGLRIFESRVGPVYAAGEPAGLVVDSTDVTERREAARELAESEARYRLLAENVSDLICTLDSELRFTFVSPSSEQMFGVPPSAMEGRSLDEILPEEMAERLRRAYRRELERENDPRIDPHRARTYDLELRHRDGRSLSTEARITYLRDDDGEIIGLLAVVRDITAWRETQEELRRNEEHLRQRQKLEAIGKLAGGVAHDFNNMLTVILGNAQILLQSLSDEDRRRAPAQEIEAAAERAAGLTRQLLAFSRKQVLSPSVVDLNDVVRDTQVMLQRLLGEDIALEIDLQSGLGLIEADTGQLQQVLVNLAVNGRDAMPEGGRLTIRTRDAELPVAGSETASDGPPGWVRLSVHDTGVGIPPGTEDRIFEPFYTTKEKGKGTGLGLSMVYGIVEQSGGTLRVDSKEGEGATFEIFFPATDRRPEDAGGSTPRPRGGRGHETILVVEDEPAVRALARSILVNGGYQVLDAADADEALELCQLHRASIDLLLTDVVMPGLSGFQLAERARRFLPHGRVLYMSGHTEETLARRRGAHHPIRLLEKPFTPPVLLDRVREALDREPSRVDPHATS